MSQVSIYKNQNVLGGWTRVDMLMSIYNLAIESFQEAQRLADANEQYEDYALHYLKGQKAVLAIHSGLKPDQHDVAYNIARLLHFVLQCIEVRNFKDAIKVLKNLRDGFAAIQSEANQLEQDGSIPALPTEDSYEVLV